MRIVDGIERLDNAVLDAVWHRLRSHLTAHFERIAEDRIAAGCSTVEQVIASLPTLTLHHHELPDGRHAEIVAVFSDGAEFVERYDVMAAAIAAGALQSVQCFGSAERPN